MTTRASCAAIALEPRCAEAHLFLGEAALPRGLVPYGISGETMPWYPSVRVLRQEAPGAWSGVVQAARERLAAGWPARAA